MQTIIAAFDHRPAAQKAVEALVRSGMSRQSIHLESGYGDLAADGTASAAPRDEPGFLHGVKEFFGNLFGEEDSTQHTDLYAETIRRGGTVVAADTATADEENAAEAIFNDMGAIDVEERAGQWRAEGWTAFDPSATAMPDATATPMADAAVDGAQTVPVVQEELAVGKRMVEGGGMRVVRRVTSTPVSEIVKLRTERAVLERRPVDRAATEADFANFKEGTVEIRERAEEAVVGKTARVVEEVTIGKETSERAETVSDSVRRTDVDVQQLPVGGTPKSVG